jgi:hypothetical protein
MQPLASAFARAQVPVCTRQPTSLHACTRDARSSGGATAGGQGSCTTTTAAASRRRSFPTLQLPAAVLASLMPTPRPPLQRCPPPPFQRRRFLR